MPPTLPEYRWSFLSGIVNNRQAPNRFLQRFLFPTERSLPTENITWGTKERGRETAPFVRVNGEAILVGGGTSTEISVTAPNIRMKKAFEAAKLVQERPVQTQFFASGAGDIRSAVQEKIRDEISDLDDLVVNGIEWLCAQALAHDIQYSVADQEVFRITYPRDSAFNITLSTFWNDPDPKAPTPLQDIHAIKRVCSGEGYQPTDAICGTEAADAILRLAEGGHLKAFKTDSGVRAGSLTLAEDFTEDGVCFLGEMGNVRFWEYNRTVNHMGAQTDLIRPKYIEFVNRSASASGRVLYYGAIPEMSAPGGLFVGRRFSKSWEQQDPSVRMVLVASRPLPVLRKKNASVSVKVVSG